MIWLTAAIQKVAILWKALAAVEDLKVKIIRFVNARILYRWCKYSNIVTLNKYIGSYSGKKIILSILSL